MRSAIVFKLFLLCFVGFLTENSFGAHHQLKLTTLNLKWFGLGGNIWNTPDQEFRTGSLRQFISQELPDTEAFVFTEVVGFDDLAKILDSRYQCATYERENNPKHQKIVLCYDSGLLRLEKYDADFEVTEVALGSRMLRPALQAKICHAKGECFAQLIGLHLVARAATSKRLEQLAFLRQELDRQHNPLPTIIAGDFNSQELKNNQPGEDDIDLFEAALSHPDRSFQSVNRHIPTFGSGERAQTLDHIMTSKNILAAQVKGYAACEREQKLNKTFIPSYSFRRYYTDHCPVTALLNI